jgi:cytochrome b subunit of formate dehydrogenase
VGCHLGYDGDKLPHRKTAAPVDCAACHDDVAPKHPFHPELAKALDEGTRPSVSCVACHGKHDVASSKDPGSRFSPEHVADTCMDCHKDVLDNYLQSSHGRALATAVPGSPNCLTCHRSVVSDVAATGDALALKREQEVVCLGCHHDNPEVASRISASAGFVAAYDKSVHGLALLNGNAKAANCVDCHGSHKMAKGSDPKALVNKGHTVETCAKCHAGVAKEFMDSIHGQAIARGVRDTPVCTDCHGEHDILAHTDPNSRVAEGNVSVQVCAPCHTSVTLMTKYGLRSDRFQTFSDSYHGLASKAGSVEVANCASCHGVHNIKPSSDPTSTVAKASLAQTCGKCHPGANQNFAIGSIHSSTADAQEPLLYWLANAYIVLIIVIIGGMIGHNTLDFVKKAKRRMLVRRGLIVERHGGSRMYLRMSLSERLQHAALMLSFIALVVTGFALKYPDVWWVAPIRDLKVFLFDLRGIVHRVAGIAMVLTSVYHGYYIAFTPRGRQLLRDLWPRPRDLFDAIGMLKYNLGWSDERPRFDRFSYVEKSEYWALVWGTFIMVATGFILWFDNTFLGLLTKLGWDIARTIHFYEAWLATLAIAVWHLYFVMFNLDVYPINPAFLKGMVTEEEMLNDHPLELERLQAEEARAGAQGLAGAGNAPDANRVAGEHPG